MRKETFIKLTSFLDYQDKRIDQLYDLGIDLIDFADPYHQAIGILLKEVYGEEGHDWWNWFFYENSGGKGNLEAFDKEGNKICYDLNSLYEYLEKNCRKKGDLEEVLSDIL
jgi:hypothetical protein